MPGNRQRSKEISIDARLNVYGSSIAALVSLIALINTDNRLNVITRRPDGDHRPGQFG